MIAFCDSLSFQNVRSSLLPHMLKQTLERARTHTHTNAHTYTRTRPHTTYKHVHTHRLLGPFARRGCHHNTYRQKVAAMLLQASVRCRRRCAAVAQAKALVQRAGARFRYLQKLRCLRLSPSFSLSLSRLPPLIAGTAWWHQEELQRERSLDPIVFVSCGVSL